MAQLVLEAGVLLLEGFDSRGEFRQLWREFFGGPSGRDVLRTVPIERFDFEHYDAVEVRAVVGVKKPVRPDRERLRRCALRRERRSSGAAGLDSR